MPELTAGLALSAILTALIKGGVALAGFTIATWIAFLISLLFVFTGWLVFSSDWLD